MSRPISLIAAVGAWFSAILAVFAVTFSPASHAGTDPTREWFTLETDHFAIHSYADAGGDGETLAREVAGYAEEAWVSVNAALAWTPAEKTHIVVSDSVDAANGFAIILPYNTFTVFAYPPEAAGELGNYANWMRLLVFHEYAHLVHIDNATGIPGALNTVLGRAVKPNEALPRWVTEGIATWIESSLTGGGRVGSGRFEMYLRTAAAAGTLPSLAELTGPPLQHPRGSLWYMMGGYLWDHIVRHTDDQAVARFSHSYGRRIIPYSLNTVARRTTGKTLVDWYDDLLADIRLRAKQVTKRVTAAGVLEGTPVTRTGERSILPRFSRDGRYLLWVETDGHDVAKLVRAAVPTPTDAASKARWQPVEPVITCRGGCGAFDFTRDDRRIIYATSRPVRLANSYGTLGVIANAPDQPRKSARLLHGARRAHDPAVGANGRTVWFTSAQWGRTALTEVDIATGDPLRTITPPAPRDRIDRPAVHPDGKQLFVSMHHAGNRDLFRVELATGKFTALTRGAALEMAPLVTTDGRWLVFSSDADGVPNIYARDLEEGGTHRLTNVFTGAFDPAVSPDGKTLVYARWGVDGHDLYALAFRPLAGARVDAMMDTPGLADEPPPVVSIEKHPYQALATMLPRSWLPTWVADSTGLSRMGLSFTGVDASGRFAATVSGEWDFEREEFAALAQLSVSLGYPDLTLSVGRFTSDRFRFSADRRADYLEEVFYANVGTTISAPDVFAGMSLGASFSLDVSRALDPKPIIYTPEQSLPFTPREGLSTAFNLFWAFSDIEGDVFAVSPDRGVSAFVNLRLRDPAIGSTRSSYALSGTVRFYLPMPPDDHTLMLRLEGGVSGGDPGARSVFALGGVPGQDILTDLINQTSAGASWLRGYPEAAFFGTSFELATLEYRFPILRVRHGVETYPVFLRDLSMAVFSDVGATHFDGPLTDLEEALR
ncbi:MAG: Tol biopolymer transport system component, partial [Myxococcota bacterium]